MDQPHGKQPRRASIVALLITNLVLLILITTITSVAIYTQYFFQPQVDQAYQQRLAKAATQRLAEHSPQINDEAIRLFRQTWPIARTALVHEARQDYPRLAKTLQQEGATYFNNVEAAFLDKVKSRYHDYLMQHRRILTAEFPEHATRENVQRVLAAFEMTFGELVERYYLDQLRHEAARTERLWQAIPPARQPEADEPPLEQQLARTAQDWLVTVTRPPREPKSTSETNLPPTVESETPMPGMP